ncbi:MAG: sulfate adenylyltransferase subunit CysD [Rhizobiales bacterium]|nr:sulfate adenylyltransferase subunit CysD [Hyphomicrobiales bacterium]
MNRLDLLESQSVFILREAFSQLQRPAMLWSLGKDSNVMIWLAKKAFFGHIPFPVIHLDTGLEFPETYAFRDQYAVEWGLNLIADACPDLSVVDETLPPASRLAGRKSEGLKQCLQNYGFDGLITGIRRDEQAIRAKERIFSPRNPDGGWNFREQPPEFWDQFNTSVPPGGHLRVHPLLHWTELDIWLYIERENIPVVSLYFSQNGQRYRSLGEIGITEPIQSEASNIAEIISELGLLKTEERAGRTMDHEAEDAFERLRSAGYL